MNATILKPMPCWGSRRLAIQATACLLLSCAILLAGCATVNPPAIKCTVAVPQALMVCRAPKPYPNPDLATQADIAAAWTDADLAAEDCKNKLSRLRELALTSKCRLVSTPETRTKAGKI